MRCSGCGTENPDESRFCGSCGAELSAGDTDGVTLEAPTEVLFGRYRVIEELGKGGMGRVVRVLDTSINEEVALKLIRPSVADSKVSLERFRNELKLARKISHRNICRMFDFAESEGIPYITMEYVRGESLRELIDRLGTLEAEQLIGITRGICRGLSEAHRQGVVHRDLKPQNIVIDDSGEARILDFGIASSTATSGLTQIGSMIGTPEYMSPEQVDAAEIDGRSDIYSLGVILHEAAVGRPPFVGDSPIATALKHKTAPVPSVAALAEQMPRQLATVIHTCLQKAPRDRYQSVQEILTALGARGERDSATLVAATAELPAFLAADAESPEAETETVFAGRTGELEKLDGHLQRMLTGRGQIVLIKGEPGSGKSTLAGEFASRAEQVRTDLVVTVGRCDAQSGGGDPYSPFRQILELLTGDIEAGWAAGAMSRERAGRLWALAPITFAALVEHGPDLLGTLLPAAPLLARARTYGSDDTEWLQRLKALVNGDGSTGAALKEAQLHSQYSRILLSLARRRPLVLVLDDVHWLDSASASLWHQLSRQMADSSILIVATCRSADLSLEVEGERHPLVPVLNELKRDYGEIEIELDQAPGKDFLDAYLDSRPNRFSKRFRARLFRQTEGHALFTVELMRAMIDRQMLQQDDDGVWFDGPKIDWLALPSRTEGVIGERIGRVPTELREILDLASIEGEEFTAEVLARVRGEEERQVVRLLSGELDRRHRLVQAVGIRRANGQRLSHYRFRHVLFRKYLYDQQDEVERSYQHEEIGRTLEELYGSSIEEVAVQLALHFEIAGDAGKAAGYHLQAGLRAMRLTAFQESVEQLRRGLELLDSLPESAEHRSLELGLRRALTPGLIALEGFGSAALEKNYLRIRALAVRLEEGLEGAGILYQLWGFHFIRGQARETQELAEQLRQAVTKLEEPGQRIAADTALGVNRFFAGDLAGALEPLGRATAGFDASAHGDRLALYGGDPSFDAWPYFAWSQMLCGEPERGWSTLEDAVAAIEELEDPFCQASALCFQAAVGCDLGIDPARIGAAARSSLEIARQHEFPFWTAQASAFAGWAAVMSGSGGDGVEAIRQSLAILEQIGAVVSQAAILVHLADAQRMLGQTEEGLESIRRALEQSAVSQDRFYDAEAQRIKGQLLLQRGAAEEAAGCFRQALGIARKQSARMFELRAATELARLLTDDDARAQALELLMPITDAFEDGSESVHVRAARDLLARLNA